MPLFRIAPRAVLCHCSELQLEQCCATVQDSSLFINNIAAGIQIFIMLAV